MIDAVKITHDPLIPEMVLFFQISTSGQRGSLSGMMKTSQTTSISSQTTSNQPLKPDLFLPNHIVHLPNHIVHLPNHICYLSNHITYLSNQIVLLPNQIIPLSNQIMMWFGRFSGCRKCSRSNRKGNFQKKKVISDISESQATYTPAMSKSLKTPFNSPTVTFVLNWLTLPFPSLRNGTPFR